MVWTEFETPPEKIYDSLEEMREDAGRLKRGWTGYSLQITLPYRSQISDLVC